MDIPLQRQLKIGNVTIGLVGIDFAMSKVLNDQGISRKDAIDQLFAAISKHNYIPPGKKELYRQALGREYDRLLNDQSAEDGSLVIRILGPGCVSCNNILTMVIEIMNKLGVAADIFQIHDLDEIGRFGVTKTPALIINGDLKSTGRVPSSSQIEGWLKEAIGG